MSSANLTAHTTYWLVLSANYNPSGSVYVNWLGSTRNPSPNGQAKYLINSTTWVTATGHDQAYQIGCLQ